MSAKIHAKIAAKVYPDVDGGAISDDNTFYVAMMHRFNLLETDSNGKPTQQAKASALDVLVWLRNLEDKNGNFVVSNDQIDSILSDPCAAIYEAAKEMVE